MRIQHVSGWTVPDNQASEALGRLADCTAEDFADVLSAGWSRREVASQLDTVATTTADEHRTRF